MTDTHNKILRTKEDVYRLLVEYFRLQLRYGINGGSKRVFNNDTEELVAFRKRQYWFMYFLKLWVIDIKMSKEEFLQDFEMKNKHKDYKAKKPFEYHRFSFCVSEELESFAREYLQANGFKKYGLITFSQNGLIRIAKKAKPLKYSTFLFDTTYKMLVYKLTQSLENWARKTKRDLDVSDSAMELELQDFLKNTKDSIIVKVLQSKFFPMKESYIRACFRNEAFIEGLSDEKRNELLEYISLVIGKEK